MSGRRTEASGDSKLPRRRECSLLPAGGRKVPPPPPPDPLWSPHRSRSGPESPENHSGLPQSSGRGSSARGSVLPCPDGKALQQPPRHGGFQMDVEFDFRHLPQKSVSWSKVWPLFLKIASLEHSTFRPPGKDPFLFPRPCYNQSVHIVLNFLLGEVHFMEDQRSSRSRNSGR